MYGYPLPFVDNLAVLDKEDVNADEVKLLIWMVLSRYFQDKFLNPLAIDDDTTASIIRILEDDDEIEINKSLYDFIYDTSNSKRYYFGFVDHICFVHHLQMTDIAIYIIYSIKEFQRTKLSIT